MPSRQFYILYADAGTFLFNDSLVQHLLSYFAQNIKDTLITILGTQSVLVNAKKFFHPDKDPFWDLVVKLNYVNWLTRKDYEN